MKKISKEQQVVEALKQIAAELGIHPSDVPYSKLVNSGLVTDYQVKMLGGVSKIKKAHFPVEEKELATITKLSDTSSYINKLEKQLGRKALTEEIILEKLSDAIKKIKPSKLKISKYKSNGKKNMTMELMLSDIHYGKKTENFDLAVCRQRLQKLTNIMLREVKANQKLFNVEKIIIALLGDIIESYTMHGIESTLSSEFSNSVQIKESIESLFYDIIVPIAKLGIPVVIPAVTGNHDRSETYRTMFNPGETNLTWIIYNALDLLIKEAGIKNVKMIIPKDSYCIIDIYGNNCLYEHGDNFKATTKVAIEKLIQQRGIQTGTVIDFARFGHWHEYLCYGRGRIIINESVPGQDSYARVMGFDSHAGQTINYYIETKERPTCFYKSFPVYLS